MAVDQSSSSLSIRHPSFVVFLGPFCLVLARFGSVRFAAWSTSPKAIKTLDDNQLNVYLSNLCTSLTDVADEVIKVRAG